MTVTLTVGYRSGARAEYVVPPEAAARVRAWLETGRERTASLRWEDSGASVTVVRDAVEFIEFGGTT